MAGFVRTPEPLSRRQIVFVRTDRLGETLLTLPVVHVLRQAFPQAHLTLMIHRSLQELFVGHPDVDEVVPEPVSSGSWWRRAWRLSRVWRSWHPDLIIFSNPKKEYHVGGWLAGIPNRVGYDRKWGRLLTRRIPDRKALGERHEVEYNLELLRAVGIPVPATIPFQLSVSQEEQHHLSQLLQDLSARTDDCVVAVHPWTSNPKKQWPVERFETLLERLSGLSGVTPVMVGGVEETQKAEVMAGRGKRLVNLVGRLSLRECAACLHRVRVLVTNDSGPMHLAAAVGTPVVALFGTEDPGSHPRRWGPWGSGHTVIHKPLEQITVEEVLVAAQRYLS